MVETPVTTLRPERFIKGSLKVTSASVFEVMVDGVSKGSKAKPDSAVTTSSVVAVPIELEPERTADIMVKVLTDSEAKNDPAVKIEFEPESKYSDVNYSLVPEKKHRFSIYGMSDGPRARSTSVIARRQICDYPFCGGVLRKGTAHTVNVDRDQDWKDNQCQPQRKRGLDAFGIYALLHREARRFV